MKRNYSLEEYVSLKVKQGQSKLNVIREVWNSVNNGSLKLEDPKPPLSFPEYIFRLDYSTWFWTCISLVLLTLLLIPITDVYPLLLPLRYVVGTIFVLFLPGYALVELLYPEARSLTPLERIALSIGLSLAIVPLLGLLLNYTPWGIRLVPIITSLSVLVVLLLVVASYRKFETHRTELKLRMSKG